MPEQHPGVVSQTPSRGRSRKAGTTDTTPAVAKMTVSSKKEEPIMTTTPTAAELSRLALAEAEAAHADSLDLKEQREAAAEEVRAYLGSGQVPLAELDTYAVKLSNALAAEQVAGLLAEGCAANVKRATAALINDDTTVADLLADVLAEVYGGRLPMRVVTDATEVRPNNNGDPMLFVVQKKAGANNAGILSANLDLTFFRPPLFASLDARKIEDACRDRKYVVNIDARSPIDHGTYFQDQVRVSVSRAFLPVPTLSHEPGEIDLAGFARSFSNGLRNAVTPPGRLPQFYATEESEGRARMELVSHKVLRRTVIDGDHRMVVEIVSKVWPDLTIEGGPGAILRQAVDAQVGSVAEDVGRVVAVDYAEVAVPELGHFWDAKPYLVTAHMGVTYRIG